MVEKRIKVVWLCHFSNSFVHRRLNLHCNRLVGFIRKMAGIPLSTEVQEFGIWITNGIKEIEKIEEVELHVVSPYPNLKHLVQEFEDNGINYHFFKNEDDSFFPFLYKHTFHPSFYHYKKNCKIISKIIKSIAPDIIHLFGAENPDYALSILNFDKNVVTIAQLQTLMNDPDFKNNYPIDKKNYYYRAKVEKDIIYHVDYIGTTAKKYRNIIQKAIKPDAIILNTTLALKENINKELCDKQFDFVYFAANLYKAADFALEAFGRAYLQKPSITLDIIGGYTPEFKRTLDSIIDKFGIQNAVTFEGRLPTNDDVIRQIRKSRYALLPLKIDLTSGTIREAMSNGLPVVTTDTGELGTKKLNLQNQNVLLSPIGDHQALANNMIRLMEDSKLAEMLRENAFKTSSEADSNETRVKHYVKVYRLCLEHHRNGKVIPSEITKI